MDTQNSPVIDAPHMKLAKVGKDRERKRGGAGWLGARGAGSGFGALGGAEAGAGGLMGTGMSLAKLLTILLVTAGVSVGAWKAGGMLASNAASGGKAAPAKLFADKDEQKYADTSGVIKQQNTIPNSLGYINNDGLTDEQRAAKKAADEAAAAKAAADAQAKADADAKAKAAADAAAAKAAADAQAKADADAKSGTPKIGLAAGKFGGMNSSFGGGGGGLSGGAGMSGGIGSKFAGLDGMGAKGQKGNISAMSGASRVSATKVAALNPGKSSAKGFAAQQAQLARGMTQAGLASGANESAAAGASQPFDGGAPAGSAITGPGVTSGAGSGAGDAGGTPNPGGGGGTSGPIGSTPSCGAGQQMDSAGGCENIATPSGSGAAPYQGLVDTALLLLGLVTVLSLVAMIAAKSSWASMGAGLTIASAICGMVAILGVVIAGLGIAIAAMHGGDKIIGGIIAAVGAFTSVMAFTTLAGNSWSQMSAGDLAKMAVPDLIASAVGDLAAASKAGAGMMM